MGNDGGNDLAQDSGSDRVLRHLASALCMAQRSRHPFPHLVVDRFFPPPLFDALCSSLPPTERYLRAERASGQRTDRPRGERAILPLDAAGIERMATWARPTWHGIVDALCRPGGWSLLARACGLEPAALQAPPHRAGSPVAQAILSRDFPPYGIGPHTDVPDRLVSAIVYLRPTGLHESLGTALFRPRPPMSSCTEGRHYPFDADAFDVADVVPFLPNRALLFARSDASFHGVLPFDEDQPVRDVLLFELAWRRASG